MRRGGGDVAGAGAQFVCFTGTKVLAYWYKSTCLLVQGTCLLVQKYLLAGTKVLAYWLLVQKYLLTGTKVPILTSLALSQGVRLLQRANALLPLDHTILGALRDLLH